MSAIASGRVSLSASVAIILGALLFGPSPALAGFVPVVCPCDFGALPVTEFQKYGIKETTCSILDVGQLQQTLVKARTNQSDTRISIFGQVFFPEENSDNDQCGILVTKGRFAQDTRSKNLTEEVALQCISDVEDFAATLPEGPCPF